MVPHIPWQGSTESSFLNSVKGRFEFTAEIKLEKSQGEDLTVRIEKTDNL